MEIYWYTKKKYVRRIPAEIKFDLENDYLTEDEECTFTFHSADDCIRAIQSLFPYATFSLEFDLTYESGEVVNFDDHLWELKEYRKNESNN